MKKEVKKVETRIIGGIQGLYRITKEQDKNDPQIYHETKVDWISDPVEVIGYGHHQGSEALIVQYTSNRKNNAPAQRTLIKKVDIGTPRALSALRANGLNATAKGALMDELLDHIQFKGNFVDYWEIATQSGWLANKETGVYCFALPNGEILTAKLEGEQSAGSEKAPLNGLHFQKVQEIKGYEQKGTVEEWRENIGNKLRKNPYQMFLIGVGLTAPILLPTKAPQFLVNAYGRSSSGKTTSAKCVASLFGNHQYLIRSCNMTPQAMQETASLNNQMPLFLDEIQQGGKSFLEFAYLMGNGKSKGQANKDGGLRPVLDFQNTGIITGEMDTVAQAQMYGLNVRAGQEMRILNIPFAPAVCFHGLENGKAHADHLNRACNLYYGAVGREYITHLLNQGHYNINQLYEDNLCKWANSTINTSAQVQRVAKHFALVETALNLASHILEWSKEECYEALFVVFEAWVKRYGLGDKEEKDLVELLENEVLEKGIKHFKNIDRNAEENQKVNECYGYICKDHRGYFLLMRASRFDKYNKSLGMGKEQGVDILRKLGIIKDGKPYRLSRQELASLGEKGNSNIYGYALYLDCLNAQSEEENNPVDASVSASESPKQALKTLEGYELRSSGLLKRLFATPAEIEERQKRFDRFLKESGELNPADNLFADFLKNEYSLLNNNESTKSAFSPRLIVY